MIIPTHLLKSTSVVMSVDSAVNVDLFFYS